MAESTDSEHNPLLGDVGTQLLFENERVKVWEMVLAPGEASDLHRHEYEYFFVVIEGESIDADFQGGNAGGKSIRIPVERGRVIYVPPGNTETAVNRSNVGYREVLVELKDRPFVRD
jgi:mannose-6-phosphate isomerase-like protein (cupin superfamily)